MTRFVRGVAGILLTAAAMLAGCSDVTGDAATAPAAVPATLTSAASPAAMQGRPAEPVTVEPGTGTGGTSVPTPSIGKRLGTSANGATTAKDPAFVPLPGAKAISGRLGNAVFRIEMPDNWNGDLVLWAHGFAGFGTELAVENPASSLRRAWIEEGYAWAASSYSENGYVPGIGADDTLALKREFARRFKPPMRTYLVGASMGGNVAALSLEHHPDEYAGALALCGALGGQEQIDYLLSWTVLGEYTSGVRLPLGGGDNEALAAALISFASKLGEPLRPTPQGDQFISLIRNLTGGPRPFFLEGLRQQWQLNFGFILADANRKSVPFAAATNVGVRYHIDAGLGLTDTQVNAGVRRLAADPAARDAEAHPDAVPTSGNLTRPLLTLHNTGDLFVPIAMEQSYRAKANAAGKGDLLVQRAIRAAGHCQFSDQERLTAWRDLVSWVRDGKKPAGEDLSGDLTNAGIAFTTPRRSGDPGTR